MYKNTSIAGLQCHNVGLTISWGIKRILNYGVIIRSIGDAYFEKFDFFVINYSTFRG